MLQRLVSAAGNIAAPIARAFRWWFGQIVRQDTIQGKAIVASVGLLVICVACSIPVSLVNGPSKPAPAAAVVSTAQPTTVEAAAPTQAPTNAPEPSKAPTSTAVPPTATAVPTAAPSATPEPTTPPATATLLPTSKPKPTAKPAPVDPTTAPAQIVAPQAPKAPIPTAVDVGAYPCQPGQIKGNRNSGIYHAPGQRDYAKTQANVECFDSEAAAQAAGYRRAKR